MIITDVEAVVLKQKNIEMIGDGSQDTVVVLVRTDEGITGIGEVDSNPYVVKQIIESPASHMACIGLRDVVVGEDAFDVEKIWRKMFEKSYYYGRRSVAIHAMSGIDMAIWDALGKKLGLPVSKLLGGTFRTKIQAYCSVLMPGTEEEIKELIDRHMNGGYQGMKLGWGALAQDYKKDVQLVRWARKHLGDDKELMIDIGMLWKDVKMAVAAAKEFEKERVFWIEEPFRPDDLESYRYLRDRTACHISGGEEVGTMFEFDDLLKNGCVDVVQPDLSRCGGLTVARKLTDMAMLRKVTVVPHAFKTNILMAATLQYIASLPDAWYLEFCEQDTELRQKLTKPIFGIDSDGYVQIPQRPGLGIDIDWDVFEYYRVK